MDPVEDQRLTALLTASRAKDAESVVAIWRELTPVEQEGVVFALLGMPVDAESGPSSVQPDDRPEPPLHAVEDTAAMDGLGQTELIPKGVEDLRSLTRSEENVHESATEPPSVSGQSAGYWSRWLASWKWCALVAAWAVTTTFAFTADVSAFGPMEWVVAISGTVLGGGLLVGTLISFVVATISGRPHGPS